jgi:hypothetical protein
MPDTLTYGQEIRPQMTGRKGLTKWTEPVDLRRVVRKSECGAGP